MNYFLCLIGVFAFFIGDLCAESKPWEKPHQWVQLNQEEKKYSTLKDEEIQAKLREILANQEALLYEKDHEFESLLVEVSDRKKEDWQDFLTQTLKKVRQSSGEEDSLWTRDLEVLTALRRVQGQRQPLDVKVAPLPNAKWEFPMLPTIGIQASRHAKEKENFHFTFGGNYRSGRQSRWVVLAWDAQGDVVQRRGRLGFIGGGMCSRNKIGDEVWESHLRLTSYLDGPLSPGRYHACIAYHDDESIADLDKLGGYMLTYSAPFEFEVIPRTLKPSEIPEDKVKKLVSSLPMMGRVKILSATYGKGVHDFIDPESSAGQLLAAGWEVIPLVVKALADPALTDTQRAWGFGILHSTTSCLDPTEVEGIVGSYVKKSGGFWIKNKINGEFASAGGGLGGTSTSSGGQIDSDAQFTLLKEWNSLVDTHIEIQRPAEQDDADQSTIVPDSKPKSSDKPKLESEERSQ